MQPSKKQDPMAKSGARDAHWAGTWGPRAPLGPATYWVDFFYNECVQRPVHYFHYSRGADFSILYKIVGAPGSYLLGT